MKNPKQITDYSHVKGTTAVALLYDGKPAGRLIANWSDNPAGAVCRASVVIFAGPLKDHDFNWSNVGTAGGYGYDKLSQAVWQCFNKAGAEAKIVRPANGRTQDEFEAHGYTYFPII
jgi:hypothetical protein